MRALAVTTAVVLVVAGLALPATGSFGGPVPSDHAATQTAAAGEHATEESVPSANETGSNVTAGSRLSGAFATQQADLSGELETRTVTTRLARANTTTARVAALARLQSSTETRLERLERERARLRRALDNGSLGPGQYAHSIAALRAEAATTRTIADRGAGAAATLPATVTTEYDVESASFRTLANRSRNYSEHLAAVFGDDSTALVGWNPFADDDTETDLFDFDDDDSERIDDDSLFEETVNETALADLLNGSDVDDDDDFGDLFGDDDGTDEGGTNDTDADDGGDGLDDFGDGLTDGSLFDDGDTDGESTPTDEESTDESGLLGDDETTTSDGLEDEVTEEETESDDGGLFD